MQKFTRATPNNVRSALIAAGGNIAQGSAASEPEALARLASLLGTKAHNQFCEQAVPVLRRMSRKGEIKLRYRGGKIEKITLVGYVPPAEKPRRKCTPKRAAHPPLPHLSVREEGRAAGEYVPDSDRRDPKIQPAEYDPTISQTAIVMTMNGQPTKAKSKRSRNTATKLTHYR